MALALKTPQVFGDDAFIHFPIIGLALGETPQRKPLQIINA